MMAASSNRQSAVSASRQTPSSPHFAIRVDCGGSPSPPVARGDCVGPYRVLDILGEGGTSRIYAAQHIERGRLVAIKILNSALTRDAVGARRFINQARVIHRIHHHHIVRILDVGHDGPRIYCVMERLEGEDLRAALTRQSVQSLDHSLTVAIQVCNAMTAVHGAGLIHGDLKPGNIFLTRRAGQMSVKLLDFGVASPFALPGKKGGRQSRVLLGSPAYVSPECAAGRAGDHRSDIYALGVVMYEMIAGERPFKASTPRALLRQHITCVPPPPSRRRRARSAAASDIDRLILACLRKSPASRPDSMVEVESALRRIADRHAYRIAVGEPQPESPAPLATSSGETRKGGDHGP